MLFVFGSWNGTIFMYTYALFEQEAECLTKICALPRSYSLTDISLRLLKSV